MDHIAYVFSMDRSGTYKDALRFGLPFHFDPYLDPVHGEAFQYRRFSCFNFHGALGVCDYSFEPAFIRKRNERERHRVRCVNEGYARLREHLPQELEDKRLSKVETLRAAIEYIKRLQSLLDLNVTGMETSLPCAAASGDGVEQWWSDQNWTERRRGRVLDLVDLLCELFYMNQTKTWLIWISAV